MINQIIKISGNLLLNNPKLNDRLLNYKKDSLRIVYYHMVSNKENKTFYFENKSINPEEFRNHIKFLKSKYEIISLQEAHNLIKLKKEMINKLVLTFDDGFKENYTIIAPILKEENITATFYLMSDFIDNKKLMWRNVILAALNKTKENKQGLINKITKEFKLISIKKNENFLDWSYRTWPMKEKDNIANFLWDEAKIGQLDVFLENEKPYLSSQQVKELIKGGFDIGSHSKTHPVFSRLDYINFENEILESINFLEKKFKYKIKSFSYPFGEKADVSFENSFCIKNKRDLIFLGINNNLENYNLNRLERDNLEFKFNMMMFRFTLLPIFRKLITNLKIK